MLDPGTGFKLYPCNGFTQRPIDAALALREEHGISSLMQNVSKQGSWDLVRREATLSGVP
jgi:hypothetical protein